MVLVDTSSWIHFLRRRGDPVVRARVEASLQSGDACWCPMVALELWNGACGAHEHRTLRQLERVLPELSMGEDVWKVAYELARRARKLGITAPASDLLIAACARFHGAALEHADSDFDALAAVP